jgi:AcrR family transcriptional regulator
VTPADDPRPAGGGEAAGAARGETAAAGGETAAADGEIAAAGGETAAAAGGGGSLLGAGIAAAWGVRPAPAKGPKPGLTLERIVAAAVEVADAEGLGAVSMNRVARELRTGAMSLYRYVDSKGELLALMIDAAIGEVPPTPRAGGWRARLERWARATVEAMRVHPWAANAPIAGPPLAPNAVAWFEDALAALAGTGLTEDEKPSVILMLSGYVSNHVTVMEQVAESFLEGGDAAMRGYADTLRGLIDEARFPALHATLQSGVFDRADPPDVEFEFGLQRILDGVEALISSRSRS